MTDTADAPEDRITVYSDYVCPFCYLGRLSLDRYRDERSAPLTVEWHPYDLRAGKRGPDGEVRDVDDGKDEAYFEAVRENVADLRERYDAGEMLGIDAVPEVDSLDTQLVSLAVRDDYPDAWPAFDEAVFDALWVDGRDVSDPAVLVDLAGGADVPAETVRSALRDTDLRERLNRRFDRARARDVSGVPTFAYGDYVARGAVPPEHLRRLVEGE